MSLYLEFDRIIRRFAKNNIRYAVVGGLAVGLHGHIRATEDMDFLIHADDLPAVTTALRALGYRKNSDPLSFSRAGLTLIRFWKAAARSEELLVVDVLVPTSTRMNGILRRAITLHFGKGSIHVVTSKDLLSMKRLRHSAADRADIAALKRIS